MTLLVNVYMLWVLEGPRHGARQWAHDRPRVKLTRVLRPSLHIISNGSHVALTPNARDSHEASK